MFFNARSRLIAAVSSVGIAAGMLTLFPAVMRSLPSAGLIAGIMLASASAIVFLVLFQGPPPATIAQVLYNTEQRPRTGNGSSSRSEGGR